jgi:hypothetical protein
LVGHIEFIELQGQFKPLFGVCRDFEGFISVSLTFQKPRNLGHLVFWDGSKHFFRSFHLASEDNSLILYHGKTQCVGNNIDVFISEIDASVSGNVSKEEVARVDVGDGVRLLANKILQSIYGGINTDITDPFGCTDTTS